MEITHWGGATRVPKGCTNVSIVDALLGTEGSDVIKDESFDAVVSLSVAGHVPRSWLSDFFVDSLRICKKGGVVLHYVDLHVSDNDYNEFGNAYLKSWNHAHCQDEIVIPSWRFSVGYISNPDDIMFSWGKLHGNLSYRASHQAITLVLKLTKGG